MPKPAIVYLLYLQIIIASILFGAVYTWVWSGLLLLALVMLAVLVLEWSGGRQRFVLSPWVTGMLFVFLLALLCQLCLPGSDWPGACKELAQGLQLQLCSGIAINSYQARMAFYQWLLPLILFVVAAHCLRSHRDGYALIIVVVGIATVQALYGIWQLLSESDPMPFLNWPHKEPHQLHITGSYICSNSYACLLAMAVPLGLGLLLDTLQQRRRREAGRGLRQLVYYYLVYHPRARLLPLIFLALLLTILSLIFSISRGAILAAAIGVSFWVWLLSRRQNRGRGTAMIFICLSLLLLSLSIYLYLSGLEPISDRFDQLASGAGGRLRIYQISWNIFLGYFWWGCGGGCFHYAWQIYPAANGINLRYAHNDYLQFLVEYGLIAAVALLALVIAWGSAIWRNRRRSIYSWEIWSAVAAALVIIAVHGLGDFSLHIPGHRLLTAILMGSLLATNQPGCEA